MAGKAVVYGGLATVGVLAYRAWQNSRKRAAGSGFAAGRLSLYPRPTAASIRPDSTTARAPISGSPS